MKTYNILLLIAILFTLIFFATPQLTGTVFVNNHQDRMPTDWLSALFIKNENIFTLETYKIPVNTKAIKIIGNNNRPYPGFSEISINENNDLQSVMSFELSHFDFSINADTLIIKTNDKHQNGSLILDIATNTKNIIIDNFATGKIKPSQNSTFDLTIENNSDIILAAERNRINHNINLKNKSTLTLTHCFMPHVNINIDNSMVYVDPLNSIDSLNVNLIGKSNIKKTEKISLYTSNNFDRLKTELRVAKTQTNIYPKGNLKYYKLN